jgi:hypothetical protein
MGMSSTLLWRNALQQKENKQMQIFLPNFHRTFPKKVRDKTEYDYTSRIMGRLNDQLEIRFGKNSYKATDFTLALMNFPVLGKNKGQWQFSLVVSPSDNVIMLRRERKTLFGSRYEYPVSFVVTKQSDMWKCNFTIEHIILNRYYFRKPNQVNFVNALVERIENEWGSGSVCYIGGDK